MSSSNGNTKGQVGIVGSGIVGRSWALLFASAGYRVVLYDITEDLITSALNFVNDELKHLWDTGSARGKLSLEEQQKNVHGVTSLDECVTDSIYVQECVPEDKDLKRRVFEDIERVSRDLCVLASSSSGIPASAFTSDLKRRSQTIIAHPVNPPFYLPLVEVVPAPYTDSSIVQKTLDILTDIGQTPVLIKKELDGFVLNRIQYAILNECWKLVADDTISVEDVDKVMTEGLGMRYAFIGPFETTHLNAAGFEDYCRRYGDSVYKVSKASGNTPPRWEGETRVKIAQELERRLPLNTLAKRIEWRNERIAELAKIKQSSK